MRKILIPVVNLFLIFNLVSAPAANAVLANPAPVCVSGTCTINFENTGDYYLWSAPTTGTYTFQVWGAQGGSALKTDGSVAKTGPLGGYSAGTHPLNFGMSVYVYVGGQGSGSTSTYAPISGGFNGGGIGYNGDGEGRAASGGGGSDIRLTGNALSNRVIVAGGGGGGKFFTSYGEQNGSFGGGTSGQAGATAVYGNLYSGGGGTQSAGGVGGSNGGQAGSGTLGNGGSGVNNLHSAGASGGGGGYFGGGGAGVGMSPGGGSGYVGDVSNSTITAGNASMPNPAGGTMVGRSGNGYIRITYAAPVTAVFTLFQLASAATTATFRTSVVISATVTVASKVTFRTNGKVISGCINRTASGSGSSFTATCPWRPSARGSVTVLATADPVTDGILNVTSSPISVGVTSRTSKR